MVAETIGFLWGLAVSAGAAVGSAAVALGVSAGAAVWITEAAIWASAYAIGKTVLSALSPKIPGMERRAREVQGLVKGTAEPRRVIYGTQRVGGVSVFQGTSGDEAQYLWYVIAIGATNGAPYESIDSLFLDDIKLDTTTDFTSNICDTGKYSGLVMLKTHLGSESATVDTDLDTAFTAWTSAHVAKGVCYAVVRFERDDEVFDHIPAITFKVKGAKVYDPRLDTTAGGSGAHRTATPSTWEWSENPALCLADYLTCERYGMGEAWSRIDATTLSASASTCEESVSIPGATTQDRFTIDGVLFTNQTHAQNIASIRSAMLGVLTYSRGEYLIYAGDYTAPTVTLTDDDLAGSVSIKASLPADEKFNSVRGNYLDAARGYQVVGFSPRSNSTYITNDNGEKLWKDIDLPMTSNEYRAQRIAMVLLKQSRNEERITGSFKLTAYKLKLWDTVTLTLTEPGVSGVYRVMGWKFNPQGTVDLSLQEETSAAWADPSTGDYGSPSSATPPSLSSPSPGAPSGVIADGTYGGIAVDWDEPADHSAASYEVLESASSSMSSPAIVWNGSATSCWRAFSVTTTRYYQVRSVGANGQRSAYVGSGAYGVGATSMAPAAVPLTVTLDKSSAYGAGATPVTTDTVTATAAGGSGTGYTYSWSRVSGDTTITANSASSAATTFNGTTNDDEAVFKCAVDDSASGGPVDSAHITVTIGAAALTATLDKSTLSKIGTGTTGSVTCTATGGTAPYTSYAWAWDSGSTGMTINSPTAATTTFTYTGSLPAWAKFKCTVTDTATDTATSGTVTASYVPA